MNRLKKLYPGIALSLILAGISTEQAFADATLSSLCIQNNSSQTFHLAIDISGSAMSGASFSSSVNSPSYSNSTILKPTSTVCLSASDNSGSNYLIVTGLNGVAVYYYAENSFSGAITLGTARCDYDSVNPWYTLGVIQPSNINTPTPNCPAGSSTSGNSLVCITNYYANKTGPWPGYCTNPSVGATFIIPSNFPTSIRTMPSSQ